MTEKTRQNNLSWYISRKQNNAITKWLKKHMHKKIYKGAIGGHITYSFTPTSIGTVMKTKCATCKKELDFSDYENW